MIDVNVFLWESIYALKEVYDHNPDAPILRNYRDTVMSGDDIYEIAESSVDQFFADTREYYNEDKEILTHVFFDPIITGFWKLCDEYETRHQIKPEENRYRKEMERDLDAAMFIPDYSYDFRSYTDTTRENGCRLVMLFGCEFCGYHWIPEALNDAYDAFEYHTEQIKKAITQPDQPEPIELPHPVQPKETA